MQNEQLHSTEKIDALVKVSDEASKQRVHARQKLEVICFHFDMKYDRSEFVYTCSLQQLKKGEEIVKQIRENATF